MRDKGEYLFTSESVSEGHPDKVADRISDTVLDTFLAVGSSRPRRLRDPRHHQPRRSWPVKCADRNRSQRNC